MSRILVAGFCAFPAPDRAGVQLRHIVRALLRHHQVDVLSVRRSDQAYVERWNGARLLRVPVPDGPFRPRLDAFRRALRRQLEGADYHAAHVRDGFSGQIALELARRLRLAVVFDAARAPLSEPGALDAEAAAVTEPAEAELLARADLVLVGTEAARRFLAEGGGERIQLVPPGVDVDSFDVEDLPTGRPRVLYAGPLRPDRGVGTLVRAMAELPARLDAELVLAGPSDPAFLGELGATIRELGRGRVIVKGEVPHDHMPALIASATVCVAPAAAELGRPPLELFPTKLLEYMACHRAVVAPRRSAVAALIRGAEHALLFDPGQPADLAAKLALALAEPERRARLAKAGYDLVRREFTASATRRQLRRAYAWLAAHPAWRARFAEVGDEPTGELPTGPTTGELSDAGILHPRARTTAPRELDGDDLYTLVEDDVVGDTGMNDVTKVEGPATGEDEASPSFGVGATTGERTPDEWLVDDERAREPLLPGERSARRAERPESPLESRFVSGEVEVPSSPGARGPADPSFVAVAPPLGFDPDETARPDPPTPRERTMAAEVPRGRKP